MIYTINMLWEKALVSAYGTFEEIHQIKFGQCEFVCSKQEFQLDEDLCEVKKVNNLETRTCCKVMIRLTVNDGEWVISHKYSYHNHELAKPEERQFFF